MLGLIDGKPVACGALHRAAPRIAEITPPYSPPSCRAAAPAAPRPLRTRTTDRAAGPITAIGSHRVTRIALVNPVSNTDLMRFLSICATSGGRPGGRLTAFWLEPTSRLPDACLKPLTN